VVNSGRKKAPRASADGADNAMREAFGSGRAEERRWRELLNLDETLAQQSGIRLLTPEARVLLHLRLEGSVPVTSALPIAGTSYRGFYTVIERLKKAGLVATVKDPDDQRIRRLSLDIAPASVSKP
jgi:DNA-binding MarR family transcriptional regulator